MSWIYARKIISYLIKDIYYPAFRSQTVVNERDDYKIHEKVKRKPKAIIVSIKLLNALTSPMP